MTKKINYLAIGIVIAFIILMVYNIRSCKDNGEEIGRLKGIIEEKDVELSESTKAYEDDKKAHKEKIKELNGNITSANYVISQLEQKDIEKGTKIEELEKDYKNLETEAEKIGNLKEQVEKWKARFAGWQAKITEKDKIIFSFQTKYNAELKLRLKCDGLLEKLRESQLNRDNLISELEKKLRSRQRASILERGAGLVVIAALAYSALK